MYVDRYGSTFETIEEAVKWHCRWQDHCGRCKVYNLCHKKDQTKKDINRVVKALKLKEL